MAEQQSKPQTEQAIYSATGIRHWQPAMFRGLSPLALAFLLLLTACGGGEASIESNQQEATSTPTIPATGESNRPPQSSAALTRVASTLAQSQDPQAQDTQAQAPLPTVTPTAVGADSALITLPTVTPTVVPSPVATRTVELSGDATLRLQLNNERFESSGQPVVINLEPRSYALGGDTMSQSDEWCVQLGPTGLVFDLTYTLHPATENLHVGGELRLYDGFCGEWGSLGNLLSTVPMNVNVPMGSAVIIAPTLQVQGSIFGLPNLLEVNTGIYLDLTIRNPDAR